ncbi:hypothetical protein CIB48_g4837 [Xylaria polymorpha]|nr:hypothetical protein CIB48_g4837 [Xylaria polymorpha]
MGFKATGQRQLGSQSGTAEIFAQRVARECHLRYGLDAIAVDLSDYDAETISKIPEAKLAIFILFTFGEGDPSDNAAGLWEWLRKDPSKLSLPTLQYTAFGLGNSNYKYYNRVVDVVVDALEKAGAKAFMPIGKADDANGGTEEDFLAEDPSLEPIDLHPALTVTEARELYTTPSRNYVHLQLDLGSHSEVRYKTGDYLAVYPIAPNEEVDGLLNALGWKEKASAPLLISALEEGTPSRIPSPTSIDAIFRYYIDICSPIARDAVKDLAQFAPTPDAKDLLLTLGKNKNAYHAFTSRNYVTIGRLLSIAAPGIIWKDLPLSYLLETLPATQPRQRTPQAKQSKKTRFTWLCLT